MIFRQLEYREMVLSWRDEMEATLFGGYLQGRQAESRGCRGDRAAYKAKAVEPYILTSPLIVRFSFNEFTWEEPFKVQAVQLAKLGLLLCGHMWVVSKIVVQRLHCIFHKKLAVPFTPALVFPCLGLYSDHSFLLECPLPTPCPSIKTLFPISQTK